MKQTKILAIVISVLTILMSGCSKESLSKAKETQTEKLLWVFIDDGALQCERAGKVPSETADTLTQANIPVQQSHCAYITGTMTMALCGTKDLNIHVHQIAMKNLRKARTLGFESVERIGHGGDKSYEIKDCEP